MHNKAPINWVNTLFLIITPIVAILGTISIVYTHTLAWQTLVLALFFTIMGGLSITAGYHRLFSHLSYKTVWPIRLIFLLFGAATFEGSVLEWCTDHRNHHRHTDTEKDPYNIRQGFWYAHIGWLIRLDTSKRDFSNVEDLQADPLVRFQHRFFVPIAIFMGFVLPMLLGMLWNDAFGAVIIAGALRITISQHMTFCINSVCHCFGKQKYSSRTSARDNWFTALFTFGEGFHNYHHQFPLDYRNGIRFFHFDPTKWLIRGLSFIGLATELRTINTKRIVQYRIDMDRKRLEDLLSSIQNDIKNNINHVLQPMYQSLMQALARLDELEKAYKQLKTEKINHMKDSMSEYKTKLNEYYEQIQQAKADLKRQLKVWGHLVSYSRNSVVTV